MDFIGWGNYPRAEVTPNKFSSITELRKIIGEGTETICFGNGRSYGDSALNTEVVFTKPQNYFLDFDEQTGLLHCQSGLLLAEIIEVMLPKGWFLKVTPGTKYVTVGGAIASDVHGKNHHIEGCFSECLKEFDLMLADGQVISCSKNLNPEMFHATCGGMGLTGVILDVKLYLKRINSKNIKQKTVKTYNLAETFSAFENHSQAAYSVAWIDCLAKGNQLGRSLLMTGDFADDGDLSPKRKNSLLMPFNFPDFVLNKWSVKIFNWLYFNKVRKNESQKLVDLNDFFYPLDNIRHWNRMYGKKGFLQYQFILPLKNSYQGLQQILDKIGQSKMGSFLAVLKLHGAENQNLLSFPMKGYSLALDFKIRKGLFSLLDELDQMVLAFGGRIYLAKDARVDKAVFEQGYDKIEKFRNLRKTHNMRIKFQSLQSKRLEL